MFYLYIYIYIYIHCIYICLFIYIDLLNLLDLMPRRRQQGRRALGALLITRFQFLLSLANLSVSTTDIPNDSQSSRTLSIHLLLGRPLGRVPLTYPYYSILENLSGPMRTTLPKHVNRLCCNAISTSLSIPSYQYYVSYPRGTRREFVAGQTSQRLEVSVCALL